ncbi:MAG: hypothetical protein H6669_19965, partial [Ardenticatenaceae bacterium]|nr:hypothetical protein [Ardenticatenaceae bacterium]
MKKLWILLLVLVLALAACGGGGTTTETTEPAENTAAEPVAAPTEEPAAAPAEEQVEVAAEADVSNIEAIRVAVVMPSTVTDLAWSQAIYDSLLRLQEQAGGPDKFEIAYT